mgnify:CR=1 FL=1
MIRYLVGADGCLFGFGLVAQPTRDVVMPTFRVTAAKEPRIFFAGQDAFSSRIAGSVYLSVGRTEDSRCGRLRRHGESVAGAVVPRLVCSALEVSPSLVYGARLLSGFGAQPHRGFKSRDRKSTRLNSSHW